MANSTPATIGAFTANVARLAEHGEVTDTGATDVYLVYVPDPDSRLALSAVSGLPALDADHPVDGSLHVVGYRIGQHQPGELIRKVYVVYEADGDTESTGGQEPTEIGVLTALDYPAYTQSGDLVCDQLSGQPVLNSAGDVFDSVPQVEAVWTGVHFTRRVKTHPSAILALAGTVNSAAVTVYGIAFQPRTARLRVGCRYTFDGSKRPYELDITIEPRHTIIQSGAQLVPDTVEQDMGYASVPGRGIDIGWDVALVECGFQYIDTGTNEKLRFTVTADNGDQSAPQLPLPLTKDGEDGRGHAPCYLIVRTAAGDTWATLNLESTAP